MAVDAEDLIIEPFVELVVRGTEAVKNAEGAKDEDAERSKHMLKSAHFVVKEGERALHRLQPLWTAQTEKYGDAFRDAISDNGMFLAPFETPMPGHC